MAYSVAQLLALFRGEVDDETDEDAGTDAERLMVSDVEAHAWLDEAQKQFARRTLWFTDASTPEIVSPRVVSGDAWVDLDPRILEIHNAATVTGGVNLGLKSFDEMLRGNVGDDYGTVGATGRWRTTTGKPTVLVLDMEPHKGRLVPIPDADDTLALYVTRYPLCDVAPGVEDPLEVTDTLQQMLLVKRMKYHAYSKEDADLFDADRARANEAEFELGCRQIRIQVDKKRRKLRNIRYGGIGGYNDVSLLDSPR